MYQRAMATVRSEAVREIEGYLAFAVVNVGLRNADPEAETLRALDACWSAQLHLSGEDELLFSHVYPNGT